LGAGGLVRAYSSSTSGAVKIAEIIPIIKKTIINIKFDYIYANEILKLFKNYLEVESKYETNITLSYEIPVSEKEFFKEKLISLTKNQIHINFID
jgi:putative IMPACT (imprinted ancient) family translation regulator